MASYEFWLTDDGGNRILYLKSIFFATWTRSVSGLGTVSFGLSFEDFTDQINPFFVPDRRLEVWRSPADGVDLRLEDVYMLRKPNVYVREDNVQVIQFYGRNGMDLLMRRSVIQNPGTSYAVKVDFIDDMMKEVVRQQMLYGSALNQSGTVDNTRAWPQNEFTVQPDGSLGPSVTRAFPDKPVFDICKELKEASLQYNHTTSANRKIYFDVVPVATNYTPAPLGWEFRTYADLRGSDRTDGVQFSTENENIDKPSYSLNQLDEINSVFVRGQGRGSSQVTQAVEDTTRAQVSRWNRSEKVISASSETTATALTDAGRSELDKGKPIEELNFTFLNIPGGPTTPRSLYGVDWDLGDLVLVNYAGKKFESEIMMVYVSVDETGKETITGRNVTQ